MATVAVLGLGLLGSGFARSLARQGHDVQVWNRSAAKADALAAAGVRVAASPAEAARGAARVHLVLAEDAAVDEVIEALRPGLAAGAVVVDHSTNQPARVAERAARLRSEGVHYLHAPVFMNPRNARDGTGLMLISGPRHEAEALRPALEQMTGSLWWVGERPDEAAVHKLGGNALLIGMAGLIGDVMAMYDAEGLDPSHVDRLLEHFNPGALLGVIGQRARTGGPTPASFALDMARKDVRLMLEAAKGGEGLVVLPAVADAMDRAIDAGQGHRDYGVYAWWRRHRDPDGV